MDYRPAPSGTPTPPYVAPYETLNFFIEENAGVIGALLVIDTSNGAVTCTFSTLAPGLYDIAITGGSSVFGLMVSSCQKVGSLHPCIASIEQTGSTNLSLFVQDHTTAAYVSNWLRLNLTIYVKTT